MCTQLLGRGAAAGVSLLKGDNCICIKTLSWLRFKTFTINCTGSCGIYMYPYSKLSGRGRLHTLYVLQAHVRKISVEIYCVPHYMIGLRTLARL